MDNAKQIQIGLQMYSLKHLAEKDLVKTLTDVKKIGYSTIDLVAYYTFKPSTIRTIAKRLGLQIPSVHVAIPVYDEQKIEKEFERLAKLVSETGSHYIVVPWLPIRETLKQHELQFLQHLLNSMVKITEQQKLQLVLHNFSREFDKSVDDQDQEEDCFVLDKLLEPFDKQQIQLELGFSDLYLAGLNPFEIYERYEARTPFVHLRTITRGRKDCLLEHGEIDYRKHLTSMTNLESKVLYIEQQSHTGKTMEDAEKNFQYITQLLQEERQNQAQSQFLYAQPSVKGSLL